MLITAGCGSSYEKGRGDPSIDPLSLLAARPALPPSWIEGGAPLQIAWRKAPLGPRVEHSSCERHAGGFRQWSDGGTAFMHPHVNQSVCVFADEDAASDAYDAQSLLKVGGEDWPNFDDAEGTKTKPTDTSDLDGLAADDWELGCGIGDPDDVCAVWLLRARYRGVLTEVEFVTSGGGIRFPAMRDLIRSIDRHVAARL